MPKRNQPTREVIQSIADSANRVQMMRLVGINPTTFYRYCKIYDIEYRNENSSYKLTADDDELVQMLLDSGFSARTVAEKMGVCHTTILKRRAREARHVPARVTAV